MCRDWKQERDDGTGTRWRHGEMVHGRCCGDGMQARGWWCRDVATRMEARGRDHGDGDGGVGP